jgi:hypothetical protein
MKDSIFSVSIPSGKEAIEGILFMQESLKNNNIEVINRLEFSLNIIDEEDRFSVIESEKILINFDK